MVVILTSLFVYTYAKLALANWRVSLLGIPKLYLYRIGKGLKLSIPFPPVHIKKICFFIRPSNSSGAKGSLKK